MQDTFSRTELKRLSVVIVLIVVAISLSAALGPVAQSSELYEQILAANATPANFCVFLGTSIVLILGAFFAMITSLKPAVATAQATNSAPAAWITLFVGLIAHALAGIFFQLSPDVETLVVARVPFAVSMLSLAAIAVAERVSLKAYSIIFWALIALAVVSVLSWLVTELRATSDLRFYLLVLVLPLAINMISLLWFDESYTHKHYMLSALTLFAFGLTCSVVDFDLFEFTDGGIRGAYLSHLAYATACILLANLLKERRQLAPAPLSSSSRGD